MIQARVKPKCGDCIVCMISDVDWTSFKLLHTYFGHIVREFDDDWNGAGMGQSLVRHYGKSNTSFSLPWP
jgi:hypothetical protein